MSAAKALRATICSNLDGVVPEDHDTLIYVLAYRSPWPFFELVLTISLRRNKREQKKSLPCNRPRYDLAEELPTAFLDKVYWFHVTELPHPSNGEGNDEATTFSHSRLFSKAPQKAEGTRTINSDIVCAFLLFRPSLLTFAPCDPADLAAGASDLPQRALPSHRMSARRPTPLYARL